METKIEMAETWYRLSRFTFSCESDIEDVFDKKIWGLELDARQNIREAHVHFYPNYNPSCGGPAEDEILFAETLTFLLSSAPQLRSP
jgi:hypothetical protein